MGIREIDLPDGTSFARVGAECHDLALERHPPAGVARLDPGEARAAGLITTRAVPDRVGLHPDPDALAIGRVGIEVLRVGEHGELDVRAARSGGREQRLEPASYPGSSGVRWNRIDAIPSTRTFDVVTASLSSRARTVVQSPESARRNRSNSEIPNHRHGPASVARPSGVVRMRP
jgi:hypothetical protein